MDDDLKAVVADEPEACPICFEDFRPDDLCADDIDLGVCHAECLEGAAVVNLETGDEMPEGSTVFTYRYDSLAGRETNA